MLQVCRFDQLSQDDLSEWSKLQQDQPSLDSPFFRPEFTQLVAQVRNDVEIAVLDKDGEPGFFCYLRGGRNVALPIADVYSDFQGLVVRDAGRWDMNQILRECGLSAWHFDHLLSEQTTIADHLVDSSDSPYVDISDGFEAFQQERRRAGSRVITESLRKLRKMEREIAPVRFEFHTNDDQVLASLVKWKREQYHRINARDFLAQPWSTDLLRRVAKFKSEGFSGVLSALYVGDELAAAHLGMASRHVLHYWQPTYHPAFAKYSPGLILLLKMIQSAAESGIRRIDLGKGDERYKLQLKTGAKCVAEGSVDLRPVTRRVIRCWQSVERCVRRSPLEAPARAVVRRARAVVRSAVALDR